MIVTRDNLANGYCSAPFEQVRHSFEANFRELNELGAAVAVYWRGDLVVDLWGGFQDLEKTRPWERDTIVSMASVFKGMLTFALHMIADRGLIDYDRPVADYWPEFAQSGKGHITVRQAISHHAALHFTDAAEPGDTQRWDKMVAAIAKQAPEWEPGTRGAYHTVSIFYIVGELIARTTGMAPWDFFRKEITEQLGVDYHIWSRDAEIARTSPDFDMEYFTRDAKIPPDVMARFYKGWGDPEIYLSAEERARLPYQRGAGNARAVAKLFAYAAMDGELDGKRILSPRTIDLMTEEQWDAPCAVWGNRMRMALGLYLNDPDFFYIGPNPKAFGVAGAGGSFGSADRENRLSIGYSANRWWPAASYGERARRLVDAVYACLPHA